MNRFETSLVVEMEFNNVVEDIKSIVREARHNPNVENAFKSEMVQFISFLDDVNFKASFMEDSEDYIKEKMLDTMDYIVDVMFETYTTPETLSTVNSIYDRIKEFYF